MRAEEFYALRAKRYTLDDEEPLVRYQLALDWIGQEGIMAVREVGCKFGQFGELLLRRFPDADYLGLEIDLETIAAAGGEIGKYLRRHDANEGLPFDDDSVDYLIALEIMEHLENATAFLREVARVLRPTGKLILSVPNPYAWEQIVANLRRGRDTEGHVANFTFQNIDALLRYSGLELLDMRGTFTRVPYSRRLLGKNLIVRTNRPLLSTCVMWLIGHPKVAG